MRWLRLKGGLMYEVLNDELTLRTATAPAEPDVWFFEHYGERIVLDANSLCAARLDEGSFGRLKKLSDAAGGHLARARRTPEGVSGPLFSRSKPQFTLARSTPVRRVVLNVTHGCNLECVYCFRRKEAQDGDGMDCMDAVDGMDKSNARMTFKTAMKGVRLIAPGYDVDVAFFGGEPLLEWELIQRVMEESRRVAMQRRARAKFHITTNAVLLDAEKAEYLSGRNCSLLVSLDGPEAIHDAVRPARGGGGSFAATMRGLEAAARTPLGRRTMARATFMDSEPRLVERLEFLAGLHEAGLINGYSVEPAVLAEGCVRRERGLDRRRIAEEYHAAAEWYVERARRGRPAGFFHFRKLTERLRRCRHSGTECGAGNGYVTVAPDGTIHACHREGTAIGHVESGIDEERRSAWGDNRLYTHEECMRCWGRYLCGGGCRQARLELGGDTRARTPDLCFLKRTMLKECLWIAARTGKTTRTEN
jgi:uncharacterized protein